MHWGGPVPGPRGRCLLLGVYLILGGSAPGGTWSGGYLVPGGLLWGVCFWCVYLVLGGGVCSQGCTLSQGGCTWSGGCLFLGGVSAPRGCTWFQGVSAAGGYQVLPPVNRMTNRCKNITLPQTSFAGGKYHIWNKWKYERVNQLLIYSPLTGGLCIQQ